VLSSRTMDSHQMYFGGSVVGKASTIGRPYRHLAHSSTNFQGGSKSAKIGIIFNITQLWAARVWKCSKISEL